MAIGTFHLPTTLRYMHVCVQLGKRTFSLSKLIHFVRSMDTASQNVCRKILTDMLC